MHCRFVKEKCAFSIHFHSFLFYSFFFISSHNSFQIVFLLLCSLLQVCVFFFFFRFFLIHFSITYLQPDAILNIIYIVINAIGIRQANIALVTDFFSFFFSLDDKKKCFCRKIKWSIWWSKAKEDGNGDEGGEGGGGKRTRWLLLSLRCSHFIEHVFCTLCAINRKCIVMHFSS